MLFLIQHKCTAGTVKMISVTIHAVGFLLYLLWIVVLFQDVLFSVLNASQKGGHAARTLNVKGYFWVCKVLSFGAHS